MQRGLYFPRFVYTFHVLYRLFYSHLGNVVIFVTWKTAGNQFADQPYDNVGPDLQLLQVMFHRNVAGQMQTNQIAGLQGGAPLLHWSFKTRIQVIARNLIVYPLKT